MTLRGLLLDNSSLVLEGNIFRQKELRPRDLFERNYIDLRKRENRVYPDEVVRNLPEFKGSMALEKEWMIRKITMKKLIGYFEKKGGLTVLELGCGNGWLSHQLARSLDADVAGLDVNQTELKQGAALFGDCPNLSFIEGDIFTIDIKKILFDAILLAGSVQYFPDFTGLIRRLLELLNPLGEIHIVDSPIYGSVKEAKEAKKRSVQYFSSQGVPAMDDYYFHHHLPEVHGARHAILHDPGSLRSVLTRKILKRPQMVFPWVLIKPL